MGTEDIGDELNRNHTFYDHQVLINYSKPKRLVGDGGKEADHGRCQMLSVPKHFECACSLFHDLSTEGRIELLEYE
jgi:hypothetical protein